MKIKFILFFIFFLATLNIVLGLDENLILNDCDEGQFPWHFYCSNGSYWWYDVNTTNNLSVSAYLKVRLFTEDNKTPQLNKIAINKSYAEIVTNAKLLYYYPSVSNMSDIICNLTGCANGYRLNGSKNYTLADVGDYLYAPTFVAYNYNYIKVSQDYYDVVYVWVVIGWNGTENVTLTEYIDKGVNLNSDINLNNNNLTQADRNSCNQTKTYIYIAIFILSLFVIAIIVVGILFLFKGDVDVLVLISVIIGVIFFGIILFIGAYTIGLLNGIIC